MRNWQIYNIFNSKIITSGSTTKSSNFFNSFSLALHSGDNKEEIKKNREEFKKHFKNFKFVSQHQVHSNALIDIDNVDILNGWVELTTKADGFITSKKGIMLNILTADCLAIIAADEENSIIGAAHSGWRGTQQEISKKLIEKMLQKGAKIENIKCAISPGICGKCYEVGQEVIEQFKNYPQAIKAKTNGKYLFDNTKVNIAQLQELGIKPKNIETTNYCTYCNNNQYFSYRKGDIKGRFVTFIGMVE